MSRLCELEIAPLPIQPDHVGIDMGLHTFATLSTGEPIANLRFFRREEKALAKVQRKHATLEKGTAARRKHRKRIARVHERIAFKRGNHAHQHSRYVVDRYQVIAMEALVPSTMVHNRCLAKSISDAAWTQFRSYVTYKAAWAGRRFIAVNPAYTSQDCHACGHRQKILLSERTYACPCCGGSWDRDHNAALNILARGLASIGTQSVEAPPFTAGE